MYSDGSCRGHQAACEWAADMVRLLARVHDPQSIGVVFDIDDTLLQSGAERRPIEWPLWLYHECVGLGVRVAVVTARPRESSDVTAAELALLGVTPASGDAAGYSWLATMNGDRTTDVPRYKLAQRLRLQEDLGTDGILALAVGDQWWDIVGSDNRIDELEGTCSNPDRSYIVTTLPAKEPARYGLRVAALR